MLPENPKDRLAVHKPPLHLWPAAALVPGAMAMGNGAKKYGPYNWRRRAVLASVYMGAILRHLYLWYEGEEIDPESGVPHLGHVLASVAILLDAKDHDCLSDDRPSGGRLRASLDAATATMEKANA